MRTFRSRLSLCLVLAAIGAPAAVAGDAAPDGHAAFIAQVRADTQWLAGFRTRVIGSKDHDLAQQQLLDRIQQIAKPARAHVWTQKFPVVVPRFLKSELFIPRGPFQGKHDVHPVWPSCGRLNTTPSEGITGKLIYIGRAEPGMPPGHLPARSLRGQIAVMEMAAGDAWTAAYNAGAQAIILLGSPDLTTQAASTHLLTIPINVPRFYIPDGPLAQALRAGRATEGTLYATADWTTVTATNIYALVPAAQQPGDVKLQQAFVIAASYDSMSVVPQLAPGADAALDAALALNLLDYYGRHPSIRPVMFAFVDAYAIDQLGVLKMLGSLAALPKERETYMESDTRLVETYQKHAGLINDLFEASSVPAAANWPVAVALSLGGLLVFGAFLWNVHKKHFVLCGLSMAVLIAAAITVASNPGWLRLEPAAKPAPRTLTEREAFARFREGRFEDLRRYVKDEIAKDIAEVDRDMAPFEKQLVDLARREKEIEAARAAGKTAEAADDQLAALKAQRIEPERRRNEDMERRSARLAVQRQLFTGAPMSDQSFGLACEIWRRVRARVDAQLEQAEATVALHHERDQERLRLLEQLGLTEPVERPLGFLLAIDLSDAGVAVGPSFEDRYRFTNEAVNAESFKVWLNAIRKKEKQQQKQAQDDGTEGPDKAEDKNKPREWASLWPSDVLPAVNLNPLIWAESPGSNTVGPGDNMTGPAVGFGTPAVTWTTLDAPRVRVDTPNDTADRLDWTRLAPQIRATLIMVRRLVADPEFLPETREVPRWVRVEGAIVDESPGEPIARVPMSGYLTTIVPPYTAPAGPGGPTSGDAPGLRRLQFTFTGPDGRFHFDLLPSNTSVGVNGYDLQAFLIGTRDKATGQRIPDGRIVRALDKQKAERGVTLQVNLTAQQLTPLRAIVFDCDELTLLNLFDPQYLMGLGGTIMDAERGSAPQRMNHCAFGNKVACFLEPDCRWQLLLRYGIAGNRMALLNVLDTAQPGVAELPPRKLMTGFRVGEHLPADQVHLAARDFYRLDCMRLQNYREAGILSKPIDELLARTETLLAQADKALERDDGSEYLKATTAALSNEIRVYEAVRGTASDVTRGVIFLLLAIVPFSFVIERLFFSSPRIYRQIGAIVSVFGLMTALLWSFHPAFRISAQPLMIIMAFGAIGMSLMVISLVFSRFETQLEEFRSGRAEASGARTSRLGLAYTAVRLGIANMRKRKLRTALTGITVVLITFALLCFMSASSYRTVRDTSVSVQGDCRPPLPGVVIALRASKPMTDEALRILTHTAAPARAMPRYWCIRPKEDQWRLHVRNPSTGKQVSLKAAIGEVGGGGRLVGLDNLLPQWDRFDRENGCYLSRDTAGALGVNRGDSVILGGQALELLGTFDPKQFNDSIVGLDGTPIQPFDFTSLGAEQRRMMSETSVRELMLETRGGTSVERSENLSRVSGDSLIIAHASVVSRLGGTLRSISIAAADSAAARGLALELSRHLAFPIYYNAPEQGIRVVISTPPLPQAPKSLLIPLAIGGLIILNTMLSSIAERKREIYIYTSLGLAPLHVGFLFLAEAITYGLMGSIFGYVAGQGVAKLFTDMGWMGGITLNYSGTQAITTMLMVISVVILSSLIPAYLAGKLAAPSNEMTWKVPQPQNDVIRDRLPFTATTKTAGGVLEFLYEYMDAHSEGVIGHFSTAGLRKFHERENGRDVIGLEGTIWLAPYDLGIRQDFRIIIRPAEEVNIYEIHVELTRRFGPVSGWWKLNRVLLADLRKQLLGWRNLKIDHILEYIARAAEAGTLGTTVTG